MSEEARFKCKAKDLVKLLKTATCKGNIEYKVSGKSKSAVKKALFSAFYLNVNKEKGSLVILTTDTWYRTNAGEFTLTGVEVIEGGLIEVTDYETILSCLETIDQNKFVEVSGIEATITIRTTDGTASFDIRQHTNDDLYNINMDDVRAWKEAVVVGEDGFLKIVIGESEARYPLSIRVDASDFSSLVKDKDITKDEETFLIYDGKNLFVASGAENANVKTKRAVLIKEKKGDMEGFKKIFYALHIILTNLFKEITLHFRQMSDGRIGLHIESHNANFSAIVETASQVE